MDEDEARQLIEDRPDLKKWWSPGTDTTILATEVEWDFYHRCNTEDSVSPPFVENKNSPQEEDG